MVHINYKVFIKIYAGTAEPFGTVGMKLLFFSLLRFWGDFFLIKWRLPIILKTICPNQIFIASAGHDNSKLMSGFG